MRALRTSCPGCSKDVAVKAASGGDGTAFRTWPHTNPDTEKMCVQEITYEEVTDPHIPRRPGRRG